MIYLPKTPEHPDSHQGITFLSELYTATVNGEELDVRSCRVSAMPFNRVWPGHQRPIEQTEEAAYATFYADEAVTLTVTSKRSFKKAVLRPLSKEVVLKTEGNTVTFTLHDHGGYVLELDGEHFALHIFFNKPREWADKEKATYYFGPGAHYPGLITLKDNDSVYIDPEAIVFASVLGRNSSNVRIFGGGVLDDSCEERLTGACYEGHSKGCIRLYNGKNLTFEDIILLNSANWVLALFHCDDILIDNVKIVGQWRYNTDGIDLTNTSHVLLKNSFVRSFDDTIVIKAINNYQASEDIRVENCVLWCGWGKTLEMGLETSAQEYRNIVFRNCNLIHNDVGAMAVSNGNYADIHDILYEDIHVEYCADAMTPQLQESDDQVYTGQDSAMSHLFPGHPGAMAQLIRISNWKLSWAYPNADISDERDRNFGHAHDIVYRNIHVYMDEGMQMPVLYLVSESDTAPIERLTIDGVYVNGRKIDNMNEFRIEKKNIESIDWKSN